MNYRVMNALRKIAADQTMGTDIPAEYLNDRDTAWVYAPGTGPYPTHMSLNRNIKTIEDLRRLQSRLIPQAVFELAPGSPEYTELRKYLYNRGPVNYHNWRNPGDPLPAPTVPQIKDRTGKLIDPKKIEAWGNTMANRRGGYGGPQYS